MGTIKVRDVTTDTETDTFESFPERLFHIPIDRIMNAGCCHHYLNKSHDSNKTDDEYTKSVLSQSLKYPNLKYKTNNLNCNSFYRSIWPEINYEEASMNFDDTQPLNRSRMVYNTRLSPRDTILTFSDTSYRNSLKTASEILEQTETPLSPVDYN